jgi:hypothetical protein
MMAMRRVDAQLVTFKFKKGLFLVQVCQTQTSYNSDPGHRYRLRVIQVNRLWQVLTHRDKVSDTWTETPAIVLKIVVGHVPYIAIGVARIKQTSVLGSRVKFHQYKMIV